MKILTLSPVGSSNKRQLEWLSNNFILTRKMIEDIFEQLDDQSSQGHNGHF